MKNIIILLFISFMLISCGKTEENKQESSTNAWRIETWSLDTNTWAAKTWSIQTWSINTDDWVIEGDMAWVTDNVIDSVNFSDLQTKNILSKIDENLRKQRESERISTWILVQGEFKAEYIAPNDYSKDTDKIIVTVSWTTYELPWTYWKDNIPGIKKCTKLNSNIKLENIIDNWECPFWSFSWFKEFSPSWNYISYRAWGYEGGEFRMMDIKTWRMVFKTSSDVSLHLWTLDKKQFIYWTTSWISQWEWLLITKKWTFPELITLGKDDILWWYVDNDYLYVQLEGKYNTDMKKTIKYLKVYDLNTLKEVFSKEI
ncbi:MAG: hypothetical protein ACD_3C00001G0010 [uncultured bacterium (gcode 4)]|uniref:Uncharacterized protein n=1 Tax=uncultured bacterium (gcode 4) TaxID=1234023 RepID=K2GEZ4_9BACT|nr:MAG: hypothetical protein ACD_3C00001G0010 [uncultured bacterium (gcode 4)]